MDFKSLFLVNRQSPGDILMLTAAVRDLKASYPELKVNVETSAMELWAYNPHLDRSVTAMNADRFIKAEYPLIHTSNRGAHHFIHGFRMFLEEKLGIPIPQGPLCVDVYLSRREAEDAEWIKKVVGMEAGYWIINDGAKYDFTAKLWETERFQQVVDATKDYITWVQIGRNEHNHPPLKNVVDLRNKTTHRQLIQLMYRSFGVVTGVSYPMHLATIPMYKCGSRKRPCVVISGGREPPVWEAYTNHQYLHTCGMLPCCDNGGCWKSRITPLDDNDDKNKSLCLFPVKTGSGQVIPKCMDLITAEDVIRAVQKYLVWNWATDVLKNNKVSSASQIFVDSFVKSSNIAASDSSVSSFVVDDDKQSSSDSSSPV